MNDYLGEDFSWPKVLWIGIGFIFLIAVMGTIIEVLS